MKVGDLIESAIWITGDENPEIRKRYENDVCDAIHQTCFDDGFDHGPVVFTEKRPEQDRVPEVPDHVQGSRVRLLVAEAQIIGARVINSEGSFIANLDKKDLVRLRIITRTAWLKYHPNHVLNDGECDKYIELIGPEAAVETLRNQYLH
ncbi:MAG: hypothetical protein Q7N50_09490 [Armatimonadota bacterium]|nr:hypothetical protein [Armatimonadota bacterium]